LRGATAARSGVRRSFHLQLVAPGVAASAPRPTRFSDPVA